MPLLKAGLLFLVIMRIAMNARRLGQGKLVAFTHDGQTFGLRFWRSKHGIHGVTFCIDLPDRLRFVLRRETGYDRFAKLLGFASEWQTGDPGFDEKVFILSEDVTFTRALLRDVELRGLVRDALHSRKGARIECRAGQLYLGFRANNVDSENVTVLAAQFSSTLDLLRRLRDSLQRIRATAWTPQRDPSLTRKAWLVGICLALALAGIVGLLLDLTPDRYQVVREAIPAFAMGATVAVVLGLLAATLIWLRSTPHTHAVLLDILLAAAPGCWAAANGAATLYNQKFDESAARAVPIEVLSTHKRMGKNRPSYSMRARGWPDARGQAEMRISAPEYQWMRARGCITALWHPGRLGDGWVSGYRQGCPGAIDPFDVE